MSALTTDEGGNFNRLAEGKGVAIHHPPVEQGGGVELHALGEPHSPVRFPGRFAVAIGAALAKDVDELARAFRGLSDEAADELGRQLVERLALTAGLTGDWLPWGYASNRIPWSHLRVAAGELQKSMDAWVVAKDRRRRRTTPRGRLAGLALRLLRGGVGGRDLLRQLDAANATLDPPLPPDAVGEVAVWAAGEVRGHRHVAG